MGQLDVFRCWRCARPIGDPGPWEPICDDCYRLVMKSKES